MHAQELEVGFYAKFKEAKISKNKQKIIEKLSHNRNETLLVSSHCVNKNCIAS